MRPAPPLVVPRPNPAVYQSELGGSRVLFNSGDRRLHVLNTSAGAIWDDLARSITVGDLTSGLSERFGVDSRIVRPDVERTIEQFRVDGLVGAGVQGGGSRREVGRLASSSVAGLVGSFRVKALDAIIGIDSTDADLLAALAEVLSPLRTEEMATTSVCVTEASEGLWTVQQAGAEPVMTGSRLAALLRAIAEVNNIAVASTPDDLVLHAGAVRGESGVALLPAASNHGKSTLTMALVSSGLGYLTDEAAAIDSALTCRPFPKAIGLDPGSFPLFADLAPTKGTGLIGALRGREWHVDPSRVGRVGESGEVKVIVCPHWRPGSSTRLTRCPPTEALHLLIGEAFDFSAGGEAIFDRLARLVEAVPVYRLAYSDLAEAVGSVRRLLEEPDAEHTAKSIPHSRLG